VRVTQGAPEESVEVNGGVVEEVRQFRYLGDVLDSEGEWKGQSEQEWRLRGESGNIWGLLVNKSIPLSQRGKVYEACIRFVMLYIGESWALTNILKSILVSCDRRMLRYMAGVTWRN
jgi:hypothetical protein